VKKKEELNKVFDEHNKKHNPSGVPFKGNQKRAAELSTAEEESAQSLPACDKSWEALAPEVVLAGPTSNFEIGIKDGSLYLHGLEDGIVSGHRSLLSFWGRYLTSNDKKDISKNPNKLLPWKMESMDFQASFSVDATGSPKPSDALLSFNAAPASLEAFLKHLEENYITGVSVEVHELTLRQAPSTVNPTEQCNSYTVKPMDECYFLPQPNPKNVSVMQENAGSALDSDSFNWSTGSSVNKHAKILLALEYHPSRNTILPRRPRLFVCNPLKLLKGQVIQLI
jgi:hypothetical protein